jgi:hypothetical protein
MLNMDWGRFARVTALTFACGALLALALPWSDAFAAAWAPGVEAALPANAGSIQRVLPGRLVKRRCVKPTGKNQKHRKCVRLVAVRGAVTKSAKLGANHFNFNGRIGGRKLGPGTYRLTGTPSTGGRAGRPQTATFTLV